VTATPLIGLRRSGINPAAHTLARYLRETRLRNYHSRAEDQRWCFCASWEAYARAMGIEGEQTIISLKCHTYFSHPFNQITKYNFLRRVCCSPLHRVCTKMTASTTTERWQLLWLSVLADNVRTRTLSMQTLTPGPIYAVALENNCVVGACGVLIAKYGFCSGPSKHTRCKLCVCLKYGRERVTRKYTLRGSDAG
jgi:hypothetical protein